MVIINSQLARFTNPHMVKAMLTKLRISLQLPLFPGIKLPCLLLVWSSLMTQAFIYSSSLITLITANLCRKPRTKTSLKRSAEKPQARKYIMERKWRSSTLSGSEEELCTVKNSTMTPCVLVSWVWNYH